jgi:hypothetical protein
MAKEKRRRRWLYPLLLLLVVAALYAEDQYRRSNGPPVIVPPPEPEISEYIEFAGDPLLPVRIRIDSLPVDAPVVGLGVTAGGDMDMTKEPYGVSWYNKGASPGWPGNALLAGHNYWNGTPGTFVYLSYLPVGDKVWFDYEDGSRGEFYVCSNDTYELEDVPVSVMAQGDGDTRTTLISCNGENIPGFGYTQRTIVILRALTFYPPLTPEET